MKGVIVPSISLIFITILTTLISPLLGFQHLDPPLLLLQSQELFLPEVMVMLKIVITMAIAIKMTIIVMMMMIQKMMFKMTAILLSPYSRAKNCSCLRCNLVGNKLKTLQNLKYIK